jgi:dTDP-4-amino-4,6-dideoxygalactose transaminase
MTMARKQFLTFGQPLIEQAEIDEVVDSLRKAWLGTGPKVHQFERDFKEYKGAPYAAAVNSCTAALHLSCLAVGLKPGDEVITTAMTFCATINAIIHSGATPVLVDIDKSLNLDASKIEQKITPKTRAILVVHFAGRPCAMNEIQAVAKKHKLKVIEDCAHAIESEYHGQKTGTIGDLGCFSFYSTKNIVTGEGGMVIGRDQAMIDRIKIMALHGLSADAWKRFSDAGYKHYYVEELGFKYNMMDLQAAIGLHQLKRVEAYWQKRLEIWDIYMKAFKDLNVGLPPVPEPNTRHAYHLFSIRISKDRHGISRDEFLSHMTKANIGVGVHYLALPEHPFYQKTFGWNTRDYPQACAYGQETVSLPISPKLTAQDVDDVVNAVVDTVSKGKSGR